MPTLHWLTRDKDLKLAAQAPYRLLEADDTNSYGDLNAGNMIIQGDNLEALKALLPFYAGQVKCIYIDPPYNTKSAFEHYDDNLEHTKWLSMIYPRLELLRDLLSDEGSVWISIDDNEGHYLKVIIDEVFGRGNFINTVVWQKRISPDNDARFLSLTHDYVFCCSKNIATCKLNRITRTEDQDSRYSNPDNDYRGPWTSSDLTRREYREHDYYPITLPSGREVLPAQGRSWSIPKESYQRLITDNKVWFGPTGNSMPRRKRFLSEVNEGIVSTTWWDGQIAGKNEEGKREINKLNPDNPNAFDTPKPERLLQRILHIATNPGDLVLDSFLGSGTTAAVAQKMGRRYIGVEIGDHALTHCVPRLKKVVDGEQGGISKSVNWQGGGGFRFFRLGDTIFDDSGKINPSIRFASLAAHIWFCETKTPLAPQAERLASPLLGIHDDTAYYLLFNGILGDKSSSGGNVLTNAVLRILPPFDGPRVIYGERCLFSAQRLKAENITFKHIPYDIKAR